MPRSLLALAVAFLVSTLHAPAQNNALEQNPAGLAGISPQAAADSILKELQAWDEAHPLKGYGVIRYYTQGDVDSLANQFAPVGISNLVAVTVSINKQYWGVLRKLLMEALWKAIKYTVTDEDLQLFLNASHSDTEFLSYIASRPAWKQQPQFISLLGGQLDRLNGQADSSVSTDNPDPSQGIHISSGAASDSKKEQPLDLFTVIMAARATGDSGLASRVDNLFQSAGSGGSPFNYQTLNTLLGTCMGMDQEANYKYVPLILDALMQDKFHESLDETRAAHVQSFYFFFMSKKTSWLCGVPEMQDAIHRLAPRATHDDDALTAAAAENILACVGDQDAFQQLVQHYHHDKAQKAQGEARLGVEENLLASVIYKGPTDDRFQTIVDNASQCSFDATLGRWVLTVPGYESNEAITNATMPVPPTQNADSRSP